MTEESGLERGPILHGEIKEYLPALRRTLAPALTMLVLFGCAEGDLPTATPPESALFSEATTSNDCLAGSWFDGEACVLASPGHFVVMEGAEAQTACLVGTYQPDSGAISCLPAEPGHFVNTVEAVAQTACEPGTYQPNSGATECLVADPGFFVPFEGATEQLPCENGFTSDAGATFCFPINTAPSVQSITGLPLEPIAVGTEVSLLADFLDPDETDIHTATIDWGDGTVSVGLVTFGQGSGKVSGSHTYVVPGVHAPVVTVHDGTEAGAMTYPDFVVAYDPDGGFVTGAGWVEVGVGSYVDAQDAEGSARFGFQARYRRGSTIPDGTTQFHFRAGGMDFRSTSYEWLVVSGARARFKGEGTINGASGFCFMLTGIDGSVNGGGDVNRLRLKVWTCSDDKVVFDNLMGAGDDAEPTAISRGNIIIHR
jgi:hypothetical protein